MGAAATAVIMKRDIWNNALKPAIRAIGRVPAKILQAPVPHLSCLAAMLTFLAIGIYYGQWENSLALTLIAFVMLFPSRRETQPRKETVGEKVLEIIFVLAGLVTVGFAMAGCLYLKSTPASWALLTSLSLFWLLLVVMPIGRFSRKEQRT